MGGERTEASGERVAGVTSEVRYQLNLRRVGFQFV